MNASYGDLIAYAKRLQQDIRDFYEAALVNPSLQAQYFDVVALKRAQIDGLRGFAEAALGVPEAAFDADLYGEAAA